MRVLVRVRTMVLSCVMMSLSSHDSPSQCRTQLTFSWTQWWDVISGDVQRKTWRRGRRGEARGGEINGGCAGGKQVPSRRVNGHAP